MLPENGVMCEETNRELEDEEEKEKLTKFHPVRNTIVPGMTTHHTIYVMSGSSTKTMELHIADE
jgi:hypothetical protein